MTGGRTSVLHAGTPDPSNADFMANDDGEGRKTLPAAGDLADSSDLTAQ
jgi:hypothetical protein